MSQRLHSKLKTQYPVIGMISAHSNGVHDVFTTMVLAGGTVWHVISVMNSSEIVPELMGCHQIGLLFVSGKRLNYLSSLSVSLMSKES